jgi:hypothetical protein
VECKSRSDTGNNRGNWSYLKINSKIVEQCSLPGKHDIKELQKTAILDTAYIL